MKTENKLKKKREIIKTERLILTPFTLADVPAVQNLANDFKIADTTRNLGHPYTEEMARSWISIHDESYDSGTAIEYSIRLKQDSKLIGATGLMIDKMHNRAELGYWIGVPFWGKGYCTEAGLAMIELGFLGHSFHKIKACHLTRNPASGRVMQKIGMKQEGLLKEHDLKWDKYEDLALYGILRSEWKEKTGGKSDD